MIRRFAATALALLALSVSPLAAEDTAINTGHIPSPRILVPANPTNTTIFLLSDKAGWTKLEQDLAEKLHDQGAIVVGIDVPRYLAVLEGETRSCSYTVSAIESLSQQLQRRAGLNGYHAPIIAGAGLGGTMALAIAAQTPAATIGGTVSVDPDLVLPLSKPFCTPARKTPEAGGYRYGLTKGALPNPIEILFSSNATEQAQEHAASLQSEHPDIVSTDTEEMPLAALATTLENRMQAQREQVDSLPLAIIDAVPAHDTMAIIISGDGGWRDIDKKVAGYLAGHGIPSVGLDALRYFWSEKTPEGTARDVERIVDLYSRQFKTRHVLLIGYSFGANVLPSTLRNMGKPYQDRVRLISLLALSHKADYQISVMGWLGSEGAGAAGDPTDDVRRIGPEKVQCIYGLAEADSACPALATTTAEVIGISGGHHFDGDYEALTRRIVDSLKTRLQPQPGE